MASIQDERGYNQGFALTQSTIVRLKRRARWLGEGAGQGTRILEIGCGTGELAYWIATETQAEVLGTDLSAQFVAEASNRFQRPNLKYQVLDFNDEHALVEGTFDRIIGNGILHHLYYGLDDALIRMARVLKPGGELAFLEPNIYNPYVWAIFSFGPMRRFAKLEPDEMAFSKAFITTRLHIAGFENVRVEYKDFLLPGIPQFLVAPSILAGNVLEKVPVVNHAAQSLFIRARKPTV